MTPYEELQVMKRGSDAEATVVLFRTEYERIQVENGRLRAENEALRAVEEAARNISWLDRLEEEDVADDLAPLAHALDQLDALRGNATSRKARI